MGEVKVALINDLLDENNAHLSGLKKVFINSKESGSSLTQFAYGFMPESAESGSHAHATMDEYFYFIKGKAVYQVEDEIIDIVPTTFIKIPAKSNHNLINKNQETLEFVYFGIAL